MCFAPQRRALFWHLNFQKWSENGVFLYILTSKCASRHNGVHFFDISTSKSGPRMVCFVHFDFEMCFAPQRRALFWHLNFQKWPENGVFCTFWLRNVLRATTACTFSTSQLRKVVRQWCALYILTSKCASRHNGVHFFDISTSKSGPRMVCFVHFDFEIVLRATTACNFSSLIWPAGSAPAALASRLFDPPEPQIIRKTQCFATFLPFRASAPYFFWLFLFSDLLSSNLSLLSASALLCFSSVHIVGSLTSKLPSNMPQTLVFSRQVTWEFTQQIDHWHQQELGLPKQYGCPLNYREHTSGFSKAWHPRHLYRSHITSGTMESIGSLFITWQCKWMVNEW